MDFEREQQFVAEIKKYVTENLPLNKMEDAELEEKIEEIVAQRLQGMYCSIDQRVSIVQQVYSSIRGFGLLDSITVSNWTSNGDVHTAMYENSLKRRSDSTEQNTLYCHKLRIFNIF